MELTVMIICASENSDGKEKKHTISDQKWIVLREFVKTQVQLTARSCLCVIGVRPSTWLYSLVTCSLFHFSLLSLRTKWLVD